MMEKLIVDSVVTWATRVQGGRLPLRPDGPPHEAQHARSCAQALDALTLATGRRGRHARSTSTARAGTSARWRNGARGVNATQRNMAGTGHRHLQRPAARRRAGRRPVQRPAGAGLPDRPLRPTRTRPTRARRRSSATRLLLDDGLDPRGAGGQPGRLHASRTGTAARCAAREIDYNGQPAGYTADPQEVITYVEAHDNETLFDAIQLKAPRRRPMAERVRMQNLGHEPAGLRPGHALLPRRRRSCCARSRSTATATTRATGSTSST